MWKNNKKINNEINQRINQKLNNKIFKKILKKLIKSSIIIGIILLIICFYSLFKIKIVNVVGNNFVPKCYIVKNVNKFNNSICTFIFYKLKRENGFNCIDDIKVSLKSNNKILINVTEKQPFLKINYKNNYLILDEDSCVLKDKIDNNYFKNIPILSYEKNVKKYKLYEKFNINNFGLIKNIVNICNNARLNLKEIKMSEKNNIIVFIDDIILKLGNNKNKIKENTLKIYKLINLLKNKKGIVEFNDINDKVVFYEK